ncbi:MAG: hypothetical protein HW375_2439 [Anaerolineales bacterium]|nr:hypothetical protein [Anaerolineales bacterium]
MRTPKSAALAGGILMFALLACGPLPTATIAPLASTPAESPTPPTIAPTLPAPTDEATPPATAVSSPGEIAGMLWKDRCLITGGEAGEPLVLGQGCVSTGPNPEDWGANQIFEPGFEPGIGGVTIHLGNGACPAIGLTSTITAGDGSYVFAGLPPGTYCVSFDALHDGNDAVLIPGGLSYPVRGGDAQLTLSVPSGGLQAVNFGWTFQFGD